MEDSLWTCINATLLYIALQVAGTYHYIRVLCVNRLLNMPDIEKATPQVIFSEYQNQN